MKAVADASVVERLRRAGLIKVSAPLPPQKIRKNYYKAGPPKYYCARCGVKFSSKRPPGHCGVKTKDGRIAKSHYLRLITKAQK